MSGQILQNDLVHLLDSLTQPNNQVRSAAEAQFHGLEEHGGDALPLQLLSVASDNSLNQQHLKILSAVLLRRILIKDENSTYSSMTPQGQVSLRSGLLAALNSVNDTSVKARISDITGELAGFILPPEDCQDILQYTYDSILSPNSVDREIGIGLLGMLSNNLISLFCDDKNINTIIDIFSKNLVDTSNRGRVSLSSIRSFSTLMTNIPQESDWDKFHCLIDSIFTGYINTVNLLQSNQIDLDVAVSYVEVLIEIATDGSDFFASRLLDIFEITMNVLESPSTQSSIRHLTLEFLVTICSCIPKRARKLVGPKHDPTKGYFANRMIPLCTQMMLLVPEEAGWETSETFEDSVEGAQDNDIAESSLYRVCLALGLRSTWGPLSSQVSALLSQRNSWTHLHTGLRQLGNYLEVTRNITQKSQLLEHRKDVIQNLVQFAQHPHPRVRDASFYAMSQLIMNHGEGLSTDMCLTILSVILESLSREVNPSPRVRRSVLMSLINYIDSIPTGVFESRTGSVLDHVTKALRDGPLMIQELCISAITSLAETVKGEQLACYYDALMPLLKTLLSHANSIGNELLWAQGMECCAMVGEASGKEKFLLDALEMMNFLGGRIQPSTHPTTTTANTTTGIFRSFSDGQEGRGIGAGGHADSDPETRRLLLKVWVRIARCLGSEFLPFLNFVMEQLLASMSLDVIAHDVEVEDVEERSDLELMEMGSSWVAIRTAAVEEQAGACQLLVLLVEKLQEHFYPYLEVTVGCLLPLLESPHDDVRSFAIVALPELVRSIGKATAPDRSSLLAFTELAIGQLVHLIETEQTLILVMTGLQALKCILTYSCSDWSKHVTWNSKSGEPPVLTPSTSVRILTQAQMEALSTCLHIVLRESLQRRAVLKAEAKISGEVDEDDFDDEAILMSESLELHYNIAELIGTLLRTHGSSFLTVYQKDWHDFVISMCHPKCTKEDRQFSFFFMSDVIEFGLDARIAATYFAEVLPLLLDGCLAPSPPIRQTCAYTIGMAAERFPSEFSGYVTAALTTLSRCISAGEEAGEARGKATDNAVSSVGVILESFLYSGFQLPEGINGTMLWGQWLDYLPLRHDTEEGSRVLRQLMRLLLQKHTPLLGDDESRTLRVIELILETLQSEDTSNDVSREIVHGFQILSARAGGITSPPMAALMRSLSDPLVKKLLWALSLNLSSPEQSSSPTVPAPIQDVLLRR